MKLRSPLAAIFVLMTVFCGPLTGAAPTEAENGEVFVNAGMQRLPEYDLCVEAASAESDASVALQRCRLLYNVIYIRYITLDNWRVLKDGTILKAELTELNRPEDGGAA